MEGARRGEYQAAVTLARTTVKIQKDAVVSLRVEMVDGGPRISINQFNCMRTVISN